MRAAEESFTRPWWKWLVWLVPQPAVRPGDGWVADLAMGKAGKGQLNQQPTHLLQGHQSNFVQVSCGQEAKASLFLQIPQHRGSYAPPKVGTQCFLFPHGSNEILGFRAGKDLSPAPPEIPGSFAAGSNGQAVGGQRIVFEQALWNCSPRLQLVLIYSGWLQFNTDQYWSGCHNSSLRFASKGSNSFDLPNRENWRAYN